MAYKKNVIDNYSYSRIACNNRKVVDKKRKPYQNHKGNSRLEKKEKIKSEIINKNVLLNADKIVRMYELNHNVYNLYNNYYVDSDKLKAKIILKKENR